MSFCLFRCITALCLTVIVSVGGIFASQYEQASRPDEGLAKGANSASKRSGMRNGTSLRHMYRCLCNRTLSSSSSVASGITKEQKSWERGARMVKNVEMEKNKYLDTIRKSHDPSQHIKTIEDELKETIGKALGRQSDKLLMYMRAMDQEKQHYEQLLKGHHSNSRVVLECAEKYNAYRKECLTARWELMVHRQAVGFIVDNHKFVVSKFPIGDPLPTDPSKV